MKQNNAEGDKIQLRGTQKPTITLDENEEIADEQS